MSSDEKLMLQYRDGDLDAFEKLYARHKGPLYRYLYRQTSNPSVADDLFQEIWMNLIRAVDRYEHKAKFSTYLFRIAHNRLIDYYRNKQTTVLMSYQQGDEEEDFEAQFPIDYRQQPENRAEVSEALEQLAGLLEKLPAPQREVFLLREEAGLTLEELAQVTECGAETVKSRLRYALKKLRAGMRHYHE